MMILMMDQIQLIVLLTIFNKKSKKIDINKQITINMNNNNDNINNYTKKNN